MPLFLETHARLRPALSLLPALTLTAIPATTNAADPWQFDATLYFWAAGIDGETPGGADVDIGFDKLVNNLNMAFMGALEARRGAWAAGVDIIYLNVGADGGGRIPVPTASGTVTIEASADVETEGWVLNPFVARSVLQNQQANLDVLIGARYLDLKLDFDGALAAGGARIAPRLSVSQTAWDAVVGVRGRIELADAWYLPLRADVGTGESDLTWQLAGGIGYAFTRAEVTLQYRHMAWRFGAGDALDDIAFSGPMLTGTFRF